MVVITALDNPLRSDPSTVVDLTIRLDWEDTDLPECHDLPLSEYGPGSFYHAPAEPLSVAQLPASGHDYEYGCSTVVRQNARYAERLGYRYERIDRADWEDDLFALRSSVGKRQGRAMHPAYLQRQSYPSDSWSIPNCGRHAYTVHGIVDRKRHLVAYAQIVQCGEVARVNSILGHWDRLPDRVMWLLLLDAAKWHLDEWGARFLLYYEHASGFGGGLRYWKERFGFRPARVAWDFS